MKILAPFRFLYSMVRFVWRAVIQRRSPVAPPEVIAEREALCLRCKYLDEERICQICQCYVSVKTALAHEACPKQVWRSLV